MLERRQKQLSDGYNKQADELKSEEITIRREYENRYAEKVDSHLHKEVSERFSNLLHERMKKQEQQLKTAYEKKLKSKLSDVEKLMKQHEQKIISLEI